MTWTIGEAAQRSGVPAKTIRYYEEIGLLPTPARAANGYRSYDARTIDTLCFVARARKLGFSIKQVEELLGLWHDEHRRSAQVRAIAQTHIEEIDQKIEELRTMRSVLNELVAQCHGDDQPDCPIVDELSASTPEE